MVKKKKIFEPGETLHCWKEGEEFMAHHNILYLGKDKKDKGKILVQSRKVGWDIISLDLLPEECFRSIGRFNIVEEILDEKGISKGYTYRFWDKNIPVDISVKLFYGYWVFSKKFDPPSWITKVKQNKCLSQQGE
jgi:hypothetical protein